MKKQYVFYNLCGFVSAGAYIEVRICVQFELCFVSVWFCVQTS